MPPRTTATIAVLHGPNLDRLGKREPEIYGHETLADLEALIRREAAARGYATTFFQSASEGALIEHIHQKTDAGVDGFLVNFGAYSHTSIALRDALSASAKPAIEVHISDVKKREPFRQVLLTAGACREMISGRGFPGYIDALDRFSLHL